MNGPSSPPYEVVEDPSFRQQAADLGIDFQAFDMSDLRWVIERIPLVFPQVDNTNLHRAIWDGEPRVQIWFTFDGHIVTLCGIERDFQNG